MDDGVIVAMFGITYSILGFVIGALLSTERRISSVHEHITQCISELNTKIGELDGKIEMIVKYLNNKRP
jgi:hypothetical protein